MFERGQGPIPWPTHTKLMSLLSKFMDGDEMRSRSFPEEWFVESYKKKGILHSPVGTQGMGWRAPNTRRRRRPRRRRQRLPKLSRRGTGRGHERQPRRRQQLLSGRIQVPGASPRRRWEQRPAGPRRLPRQNQGNDGAVLAEVWGTGANGPDHARRRPQLLGPVVPTKAR